MPKGLNHSDKTPVPAIISKVVDSFWIRNCIILVLLLTSNVAKRVVQTHEFSMMNFLNLTVTFTILYSIFVVHNRIFYEKLLRKKKYLLYSVLLIGTIVIYNDGVLPISQRMFGMQWDTRTFAEKLMAFYSRSIDICIGLVAYLAFSHLKASENKWKLESLNRELELLNLKKQLDPHFLFNALNNIYSYTLENSSQSGELVLKLSELMRHIVESAQSNSMQLIDEVNFVQAYTAFEVERLGDRCETNIATDIQNPDAALAPFILFVFVENAFKHGTAINKKALVNINIRSNAEKLEMTLVNTIHRSPDRSTGIGLANTKRRLELLYPGRYELSLTELDSMFHTNFVLYY